MVRCKTLQPVQNGESTVVPLDQRIRTLLGSAPVMLLMKGSPEEPRCGFSRRVVEALQKDGIVFKHFDILGVSQFTLGVGQDQQVCRTI